MRISHSSLQQLFTGSLTNITGRYPFKFPLQLIQIRLIFPQLGQKHSLHTRLQTPSFKVHFPNLPKPNPPTKLENSKPHNNQLKLKCKTETNEQHTRTSQSSRPDLISLTFAFFSTAIFK